MASPPIVTKGVSKWSLNPDDNATADDRINWQEGQMPSSVNNSARAMMMRIREQHDLNQSQFKSVLDTVNGRFGNQIKEVRAESYTIEAAPYPANHTNITFKLARGDLTADEHEQFKAGKLHLYAHLIADKIEQNAIYKTFAYNSIIAINLNIKVGNNQSSYPMQFRLNFFGIEKANYFISFHELQYFVNRHILITGNNSELYNTNAIPMTRSYTGTKPIVPNTGTPSGAIFNRHWYYISPIQCIFIDSLQYVNNSGPMDYFFSLPKVTAGIQILNHANMGGTVYLTLSTDMSTEPGIQYSVIRMRTNNYGLFSHLEGNFTYLITSTPENLTDYPMILKPTATNPYPIIV